MKNLMLPLIAVLLFAACQNTPAPATTPENAGAPAGITIDPAKLKASASKANELLQSMNNFNNELSEASKSMTEAQKNEVEGIRSQLNDLLSKHEMMTKGLQSADNAGGKQSSELTNSAVPTPGVVQDYMESIDRYDQLLGDLRSQLEAVKTGKSKGK